MTYRRILKLSLPELNPSGLTLRPLFQCHHFFAAAWFLPVCFLFLLLQGSVNTAFAQSCGGPGQRACCIGEAVAPCNSGYVQSPGCDPSVTGGCACSNLAANSLGTCVPVTGCGGPGQRACCITEGPACNSGLISIPACDSSTGGSCACGPNLFVLPDAAAATCVQPTACGGVGQRACCGTESATACATGLQYVDGCAGDCTCGGINSTNLVATGSCGIIQNISEPTTNSTPSASEPATNPAPTWTLPSYATLPSGPECPTDGSLCGYADLHLHMFANLGHGKGTLAGEPYDALNGINGALSEDFGTSLQLVGSDGVTPRPDVSTSCPAYLQTAPSGNWCLGQARFHGNHSLSDSSTGIGTNDAAASNLGLPLFNGWPQWNSTVHQQVYYRWLERAWIGGLRLVVMDAVTNEALCKSSIRETGQNCALSMTSIDEQLQAARYFQSWLDARYGGAGNGWFRIVTTPAQATAAIQQGKLAVVLGIEVDNLFNCHFQNAAGQPVNGEGPSCTAPYVLAQLQSYYNQGVRHFFPIHNFDNAFGNPAAWQDAINVGNFGSEGEWWAVRDCKSLGYGFYLNQFIEDAALLLGFGATDTRAPFTYTNANATCHGGSGLTSLGSYLVNQMMLMGTIIDVDHMSLESFDSTLNTARHPVGPTGASLTPYPGIAATHVQFFDLYQQNYTDNGGRHERMRTSDQLNQIKSVGGMISVMLKDDVQDTVWGWCLPGAPCLPALASGSTVEGGKFTPLSINYPADSAVINNCRYSTTEWSQAYLFGAASMGGPVSMGSDFNGVAGHVGPRFGSGSCGGNVTERSAQEKAKNQLRYPFTLEGFGTFDRQVTGQRTFDFNKDGLAHVGLLPDMIADMKQVGVTNAQLQPLFGSAQAYINMWQKANAWAAAAQTAPVFTSANSAYFQTGVAKSLFVVAAGAPAPVYSYTGTLPSGVTFNAGTGTLGGTAAAGTAGTYTVVFTAANGILPNATQTFTLTVYDYPAITSANSATFQTASSNTFSVTATGTPAPVLSLLSGNLPNGVTFVASPIPGSATISGAPAAGTGGQWPITIQASSIPGWTVTQTFTLTVNQAPAITSATTAKFILGTQGSFTLTGTGYPAPAFSIPAGALPAGLTFNAANSTISGMPTATAGTYPFTVTLSNGINPPAQQYLTVEIDQAPGFSVVSSSAYLYAGNDPVGTFAATGYPAPTITATGLPPNVTINPSTGALSGKPPLGSGGLYTAVITASNGVSPNAVLNAGISVYDPPSIPANQTATLSVGYSGAYTMQAGGYPQPFFFTETGTLPSGILFNQGTGTFYGIAATGTAGTYTFTVTAANNIPSPASQTFTLVINNNRPPSITSSNTTTFVTGAAGSFSFTATAIPAATFSYTGALPDGVTFNSAGLLSGTPAAGTGGNYPLAITASNGILPTSQQAFTLVVNQPPAITSANTVTFSAGASGTFTVKATGFPAPTFSLSGNLPSGVTLNPATGVLSGTPGAGTGGSYPVTLTAGNNVTPNSTQSFTLVVNQSPVFTSANAVTFNIGGPNSFSVTAGGYPAPTFSATGALPSGIALNPSTGMLSGTPAAGSSGNYPITLTASNGISPAATQSFSLSVALGIPAITWFNPTPVNFGTALGPNQLNAAANTPGTFVYSPPAGTVLPPGNLQTISATFTPSDLTSWAPVPVQSQITVFAIPATAPAVGLITTQVLTRDPVNNLLVVTLTIANTGQTTAQNAALKSVQIGSKAAASLPAVGSIASGSTKVVTVTFPLSAVGASGSASTLSVSGTYTGGSFSANSRITLP